MRQLRADGEVQITLAYWNADGSERLVTSLDLDPNSAALEALRANGWIEAAHDTTGSLFSGETGAGSLFIEVRSAGVCLEGAFRFGAESGPAVREAWDRFCADLNGARIGELLRTAEQSGQWLPGRVATIPRPFPSTAEAPAEPRQLVRNPLARLPRAVSELLERAAQDSGPSPEGLKLCEEVEDFYLQNPRIVDSGRDPNALEKPWRRRGKDLLPLLPTLLRSNRASVRQEGLELAGLYASEIDFTPQWVWALTGCASAGGPALKLLGQCNDLRAAPTLLSALRQPAPTWWQADEALRAMTGLSPLPPPIQDATEYIFDAKGPRTSQADLIAAWNQWWEFCPPDPTSGGRNADRSAALRAALVTESNSPGRPAQALYFTEAAAKVRWATGRRAGESFDRRLQNVWAILWRQRDHADRWVVLDAASAWPAIPDAFVTDIQAASGAAK